MTKVGLTSTSSPVAHFSSNGKMLIEGSSEKNGAYYGLAEVV